jgi:hypothetical protein
LSGFFVSGAPATLLTNINPGLGLVNGSAVIMDSLSLNDDENLLRINYLLEHSQETDILLDHPPRYIAARIAQPTDALKRVVNGSLIPQRGSVVAVYPHNHCVGPRGSTRVKAMFALFAPHTTRAHCQTRADLPRVKKDGRPVHHANGSPHWRVGKGQGGRKRRVLRL